MAKNKTTNGKQTNFFASLDRLPIGKIIRVPISETEIGGELLNILSKGLYTNPLDAIREYVQNSIDAGAEEVTINVTGNSVNILDRGSGMNRNALLLAREFGVSKKSIETNVGFRGIGIYSGFDLCERLIIRTKIKGENVEHFLEFAFKDMREILEKARKDPKRPSISLSGLLGTYTFYHSEPSNNKKSDSFTIVQLQELSEEHIYRLSNTKEMQEYVLRNLPIRFGKDFKYGDEIERDLIAHVPGYKSARVILSIDSSPPITVEKSGSAEVSPPRKGFINSFSNIPIAYYWACLSNTGEKLKEDSGIVYKVKGFAIGNREYLRSYHPRIYDWWMGEIYVIDTNVIPTSARDDFEANRAKQELSESVRALLSGANNPQSLQKIAIKAQESLRANEVVDKCLKNITSIQEEIDSGNFDQFILYSKLDEVLKNLKAQKNKSTKKALWDKLDKQAKALQKFLKKEISKPTSIAERKQDAVKSALEDASQEQSQTQDGQDDPKESSDPSNGIRKNLLSVIESQGWTLDSEWSDLLVLIDNSMADILDADSDEYSQIMATLDNKLSELP